MTVYHCRIKIFFKSHVPIAGVCLSKMWLPLLLVWDDLHRDHASKPWGQLLRSNKIPEYFDHQELGSTLPTSLPKYPPSQELLHRYLHNQLPHHRRLWSEGLWRRVVEPARYLPCSSHRSCGEQLLIFGFLDFVILTWNRWKTANLIVCRFPLFRFYRRSISETTRSICEYLLCFPRHVLKWKSAWDIWQRWGGTSVGTNLSLSAAALQEHILDMFSLSYLIYKSKVFVDNDY